MIEPHSAQDGESALTEKATFVVPPKLNGIDVAAPVPIRLPVAIGVPVLAFDDGHLARRGGSRPDASAMAGTSGRQARGS